MAFLTYFCMYAFRKPFAAASYEGFGVLDGALTAKTAFVLSQLVGYTLSKYIGIKVGSEVVPAHRLRWNLGLIAAAQLALVGFAFLPGAWKLLAIFANGLPLGMVWGLCVSYLEGRRASDLLLVMLSCSFIVSSGVVKDVGRWLMSSWAVPEFWMPACTGLIFLPAFAGFAWGLQQLPAPSPDDQQARTTRAPMDGDARLAFLKQFLPGLLLLIVVYFLLTAFRDFRDNYGIDLFVELGKGDEGGLFSRSELPVAAGVMAAVAVLFFVRDNRRGVQLAFGLMIFGMGLLVASTWLFEAGGIGPLSWMIATGLGSYLAYVPYNSVLFDRLIAYTRVTSTAVFTIFVADAAGYTGSLLVQLYKDLYRSDATRLEFFLDFCVALGLVGVALLSLAAVYFLRRGAAATASGRSETDR